MQQSPDFDELQFLFHNLHHKRTLMSFDTSRGLITRRLHRISLEPNVFQWTKVKLSRISLFTLVSCQTVRKSVVYSDDLIIHPSFFSSSCFVLFIPQRRCCHTKISMRILFRLIKTSTRLFQRNNRFLMTGIGKWTNRLQLSDSA